MKRYICIRELSNVCGDRFRMNLSKIMQKNLSIISIILALSIYAVFFYSNYINILSIIISKDISINTIKVIYFNVYVIILLCLNLIVIFKLLTIFPMRFFSTIGSMLVAVKKKLFKKFSEFIRATRSFYATWYGRIVLIFYIVSVLMILASLSKEADFWLQTCFIGSVFIGIISIVLYVVNYLKLAKWSFLKLLFHLGATFFCMLLSYFIEESSFSPQIKLLLVLSFGVILQLFLIHETISSLLKFAAYKLSSYEVTLIITSYMDYIALPTIMNSHEIHELTIGGYLLSEHQIRSICVLIAIIINYIIADKIFKRIYEFICNRSKRIEQNKTIILVALILFMHFGGGYFCNHNEITSAIPTLNDDHQNLSNNFLTTSYKTDITEMQHFRQDIKDKPPIIQFFQVSPRNLTYGSAVTATFTVVDRDSSGLNRIELWRKSERGNWEKINKTLLHGYIGLIYDSFEDVPESTGCYWYGIRVFDNANNSNDGQNYKDNTNLNINGSISVIVNYKKIKNQVTDLDPPNVLSFNVDPRKSTNGIPFAITYNVSDQGGSGLKRIELWQKGDGRDWHMINGKNLNGRVRPVAGSFEDSVTPKTPGSYWYGIRVYDISENWNDERNSNSNYQPNSIEPIKVTVDRIPGYSYSSVDSGSSEAKVANPPTDIQNYNYARNDSSENVINPAKIRKDTSENSDQIQEKSLPESQDIESASSELSAKTSKQQESQRPDMPSDSSIVADSTNSYDVPVNEQIINYAPNSEKPSIGSLSNNPEINPTEGTINIQNGSFKINIHKDDSIKVESLRINNFTFDLTVRNESSFNPEHVELWRKYEDGEWQEIKGSASDDHDKIRFIESPAVPGNYSYQLR